MSHCSSDLSPPLFPATVLSHQFRKKVHLPWGCLFVAFQAPWPRFLGCSFPLAHAVFGVNPDSPPLSKPCLSVMVSTTLFWYSAPDHASARALRSFSNCTIVPCNFRKRREGGQWEADLWQEAGAEEAGSAASSWRFAFWLCMPINSRAFCHVSAAWEAKKVLSISWESTKFGSLWEVQLPFPRALASSTSQKSSVVFAVSCC